MASTSKVTRANVKTESLRTTVPEDIAKAMKLQPGVVLDWQVVEEKGRKFAKFRKLE